VEQSDLVLIGSGQKGWSLRSPSSGAKKLGTSSFFLLRMHISNWRVSELSADTTKIIIKQIEEDF
jgi:hypothetical protein